MAPRNSRAYASLPHKASPLIVWALIAAIVIGGLPILTGVVVMPDSNPAFTLDVCHPLGGASHNLGQGEAPLVPAQSTAQLPKDSGAAPEFLLAFSSRVSKAPDPPPPKIGA